MLTLAFAVDPTPWYQDFAFWGIFIGILIGAISVTRTLMHLVYRERIRSLSQERDRLKRELRESLDEVEELKNAGPVRDELVDQLVESQEEAGKLQKDLDKSQEKAARLQKFFDGLNRKLRIAHQLEGLTWRALPTSGAAFVPLSDRLMPVLAVLNLKGGVGKTTLTANLGAAYARAGWRVLLIDLDLQASLTSLFITGEQLQRASEKQRLIQHYFEQSAAGQRPQFLDFIHSSAEPRLELTGSADTLSYAELNLTVRWFLQPANNDPRLILREALHRGCAGRFDLVLIDCPPLLNVSCVNALAAADFLLIPVVPSKSATDRVRPMITHLRILRKNLNPDLKIIGVGANRIIHSTGMSADESNLWALLRDQCHDAWGEPVPMCQTFIPQSVEVRNAENERRPLKLKDQTFDCFKKLAAELAGRLPQSSRPANLEVRKTGATT